MEQLTDKQRYEREVAYKRRMKYESIRIDVDAAFEWALENHPSMYSFHDGYAILFEEVDELWDEVKASKANSDTAKMWNECSQIAAMAMRYMFDLCEEAYTPAVDWPDGSTEPNVWISDAKEKCVCSQNKYCSCRRGT